MIDLIGFISIAVLFNTAEPILLLKRRIGFKEELYDTYSNNKKFFHRGLYCCMCSGFWIGLILTGNIFTASIISIGSELINKKIIE
jgi:hypothetical protein